MTVSDELRARIEEVFAPQVLEIVDESEKHRGHGGWREGGETHFHVTVRAAALAPMGRIERHRAVHRAIGDLATRIHALALDLG